VEGQASGTQKFSRRPFFDNFYIKSRDGGTRQHLFLLPTMSVSFTLPKEYAFVAAAAVATGILTGVSTPSSIMLWLFYVPLSILTTRIMHNSGKVSLLVDGGRSLASNTLKASKFFLTVGIDREPDSIMFLELFDDYPYHYP
jgi:hypothetical protein